jgi:hypothetical protein
MIWIGTVSAHSETSPAVLVPTAITPTMKRKKRSIGNLHE